MQIWRWLSIAVAFAVAHFVVYLILFDVAHYYGMTNRDVPLLVQVPLTILGTPLVYLLWLPPSAFGSTQWWGDDSNLFIGTFVTNALLWGTVFSLSVWWFLRHRPRSDASKA